MELNNLTINNNRKILMMLKNQSK